MAYEELLMEAQLLGIDTYEEPMTSKIKGLYSNNIIWINKNSSITEKFCTLSEEIAHHLKTVGDILDQSVISNRKQELLARTWAYEKLIPLSKIVQAQVDGVRNRFELAEYLGVTEEFLQCALDRYRDKYGIYTFVEGKKIFLDPLTGIKER